MPAQSTNGQARANEKIVIAFKLNGALPTDYTKTTLDTYLGVDVDDTTYLKVETSFSFTPTAVESTADTEGVVVTLENDVAGTMVILNQTPEDAENLMAAFNNVKCDVVLIYGDPDLIISPTQTLSVSEGDRIAIIQGVVPQLVDNFADATDYKITATMSKKIGATDRPAVYKTVLAAV